MPITSRRDVILSAAVAGAALGLDKSLAIVAPVEGQQAPAAPMRSQHKPTVPVRRGADAGSEAGLTIGDETAAHNSPNIVTLEHARTSRRVSR
jgi:hypothetical protein